MQTQSLASMAKPRLRKLISRLKPEAVDVEGARAAVAAHEPPRVSARVAVVVIPETEHAQIRHAVPFDSRAKMWIRGMGALHSRLRSSHSGRHPQSSESRVVGPAFDLCIQRDRDGDI